MACVCSHQYRRSAAIHLRIMNDGHRENARKHSKQLMWRVYTAFGTQPGAVEAQRASTPNRESRGHYVSERYRKGTARCLFAFSSLPRLRSPVWTAECSASHRLPKSRGAKHDERWKMAEATARAASIKRYGEALGDLALAEEWV